MSDVYVYIYDLSHGLAQSISASILGKEIKGIWHTGIVVFGKEIYFGSNGISSCAPEGTILGPPNEKVLLGKTNKTEAELEEILKQFSNDIFHGTNYDLLCHNCNNFSNELSYWLLNQPIPEYVVNLPHEVFDTPMGKMLQPFLSGLSPNVAEQSLSTANYYDDGTVRTNEVQPVFYQEQLIQTALSFNNILDSSQEELIENLFQICCGVDKNVTHKVIDLLILATKQEGTDEYRRYIYEIMKVCVMKNNQVLSILSCQHYDWLDQVYSNIDTDSAVKEAKLKFLCNFFGKTLNDVEITKYIPLTKICNGVMNDIINEQEHFDLNVSLFLNLLLNKTDINDELMEINCYYIHLITEDHSFNSMKTKENIIASIYLSVKQSSLIRDLAKAQDLHKRTRRQTKYCRSLYKQLQ